MSRKTILPLRRHTEFTAQVAAQFRYSRFTQQDYLRDWALQRGIDQAAVVTCRQFREQAKQKGWGVEWLTEQVKGHLEAPAATIRRVMGLAEPTAVIPYQVLIDLYHGKGEAAPKPGYCRDGCDQRVMGRQKYASDRCRKRAARGVA